LFIWTSYKSEWDFHDYICLNVIWFSFPGCITYIISA
jgi:hypothetical protein